jgi:hypothetical protein
MWQYLARHRQLLARNAENGEQSFINLFANASPASRNLQTAVRAICLEPYCKCLRR